MNSTDSSPTPSDRKLVRRMTIAWALILLKCALIPWAIQRWDVPIHPGWIVWPTLLFAGFATLIVFLRRSSPED